MSDRFPDLPLHPEGESPELPATDRGAIAEALAASKVGLGELAAAVDLGTNTALLVVGKVEDGELVVVEEHGAPPRRGAQGAQKAGVGRRPLPAAPRLLCPGTRHCDPLWAWTLRRIPSS